MAKTDNVLSLSKPSFWILSICFFIGSVCMGLIAYNAYNQVRSAQEAEAAKQNLEAKLAADPITVSQLYSALNTQRSNTGAPALASVQNLTAAADQFCSDMVTGNYFDYKNPATGKEANSFISDNTGDLYFKTYVSSIFSGDPNSETASDVVSNALKNQFTQLGNPEYNSVGIAICTPTLSEQPVSVNSNLYIVAMLANKQDPPIKPAVQYVPTPTYTPPQRTYPSYCRTTYNTYGGYFDPTASTYCY